jgi:hypothetical protein
MGALGALVSCDSPTPAENKKPVKIGVLTDMSSLYADVTGKGSVLAAQMAVEDFGEGLPGDGAAEERRWTPKKPGFQINRFPMCLLPTPRLA